jgi:hypothetical protein
VVPALAVQSEYGFTVEPSPFTAQDPRANRAGFDAWHKAGVDSMLIVPRASTHLEYTDIALVMPASRWGQALTSAYTQRWLDRYLKHRSAAPLLDAELPYLEPVAIGRWDRVALDRASLLSFYHCSSYAFGGLEQLDLGGVGGC